MFYFDIKIISLWFFLVKKKPAHLCTGLGDVVFVLKSVPCLI